MRTVSVLTKKPNLEHLHTIEKFPVYMGCVSTVEKDVFKELTFDICRDTGIIQLRTTLPLSLTNIYPHNDNTGKLWESHNEEFLSFISSFGVKNVMELGGGSGKLAHGYLELQKDCQWTIHDKNYIGTPHRNIQVKYDWFNTNTDLSTYDAVIHSHVFEHIHQPNAFLKNVRKNVNKEAYHIFSVPNLYEWLKNKYMNCLNFEHTLFLTEDIIDELLEKNGFRVVRKQKYKDHSIFYACLPCSPNKNLQFKNRYTEYKELFVEFVEHYNSVVSSLNAKIQNETEVYLFGAHIFSQYLISRGLDIQNIKFILDNSRLKNKQRLYGTSLRVEYPDILKDKHNPVVILLAGVYSDEIRTDILQNIQSSTTFLP